MSRFFVLLVLCYFSFLPSPLCGQEGSAGVSEKMQIQKNISYRTAQEGEDASLLQLDIYSLPGKTPQPVMIYIHGGGWRNGDKGRVLQKAQMFTRMGFVFVSINYRLSPKVLHPAHVEDCASAIAWVHKNIASHQGDPKALFVIGHSAGAHLAALVTTDHRRLQVHGVSFQNLKGTILLDGAGYDIPLVMKNPTALSEGLYKKAFGVDPKVWEDASPMFHIASGKNIPPFLIVHAGNRILSQMASKAMASKMKGCGYTAKVFHAASHNHGSVNQKLGVSTDEITQAVLQFLLPLDSRLRNPYPNAKGQDSTEKKDSAERRASAMMKLWDRDQNGYLTREEVPSQHQEKFDQADENKDGKVSLEELKNFFQKE